ncbi:uncharacterized protein LOC121386222 [Gigantopelta aegis]|uniref:uncharacterized protein LOC121386222 n=1 Tax=Gigantopelta aegis TaxID=1735272 RepID=UPI001B88ACE0|nr:uncharacterized protein LOC121386222 [Gigantopelta aegis]
MSYTCTLCLWMCILVLIPSVSGVANTAINCMGGGYSGQSSTLACAITGSIASGIRWVRPNGGSPQEVIWCNVANTMCIPAGGLTGYSASIDSPTQTTLTIDSFDAATDAGEWICRDGLIGQGPSSCNKTFFYGPIEAQ